MTKALGFNIVVIFVALSIATAVAQQKLDPRIADFIQAGKIRVRLFPPQYIKESKTSELRSVWVEVARALAGRIGVELITLERPTPPAAVECLKADECDVIFFPGSRVLEDYYGANLNRAVVPKGRPEWLAYVNEFVEEAKASGLIQKAIDRVGPRGITVAPPGNSN